MTQPCVAFLAVLGRLELHIRLQEMYQASGDVLHVVHAQVVEAILGVALGVQQPRGNEPIFVFLAGECLVGNDPQLGTEAFFGILSLGESRKAAMECNGRRVFPAENQQVLDQSGRRPMGLFQK